MNKDLSIVKPNRDELELQAFGLDTELTIWDMDGFARIDLTWVEAQQLYRWLKERLGE